jgi:hypothetical protein
MLTPTERANRFRAFRASVILPAAVFIYWTEYAKDGRLFQPGAALLLALCLVGLVASYWPFLRLWWRGRGGRREPAGGRGVKHTGEPDIGG